MQKKDYLYISSISLIIISFLFVFPSNHISAGSCSKAIEYACNSWGLPKHMCNSSVDIWDTTF